MVKIDPLDMEDRPELAPERRKNERREDERRTGQDRRSSERRHSGQRKIFTSTASKEK